MAFLDELKGRTLDLAQAGMVKSKQLMEIAKLNLANSSEEDAIKKAYLEIGKLYYAERGKAPEAAYVTLCQKITDARINIEENRARIAELKSSSEVKDADLSSVETEIPSEEPASAAPSAPPEGSAPDFEEDPVDIP